MQRDTLVNPLRFHGAEGSQQGFALSEQITSLSNILLTDLQVAQAVLLPFLVDRDNVGALGLDAVRQMILMSPPENRRVCCRPAVCSLQHLSWTLRSNIRGTGFGKISLHRMLITF